ncbi:uncharacterized protein A1O9_02128 [Exophiala aquamarina CBS 119918]|uniref:FAD-binding FR-type domain-containing protein n=1 Tax=Exophiala aquamarina CBS 119918 TaxID=1182545 RepID=A0A072PLC9_9EURO|nr:uncharacterized protein A1O9_02128 [Exophiala aquamarina CBS 119918]KEF60567.1 hypothetical protein A1O9_02128 [Exophiala aquamarina CBS 119918]
MAYAFILSLTPAQIQQRRKQLDQAGYYAWLTPIILVLAVYLYRKATSILTSLPASSSSNPAVARAAPSQVQIITRRISWILGTTYIPEFGPLHVQLTGLIYTVWLLYLVFHNTGEDYMHLTKAFGHVAVSQLPVHYLLSFKTPLSPITLATGLTHEKLNPYHRLLGRVIHFLLSAHAVMYIRFFIQLDALTKRIKDRDVRLGLAAFWAFNLLGLLAVPPVRRKVYHAAFYRSHVLLSALVLPALFFHVPYTRKYILQAGLFWVVGGMTRGKATAPARMRTRQVHGTNLVEVKLTMDKARSNRSSVHGAVPGSHVYIQSRAFGPKSPFTVLNVGIASSSSYEEPKEELTLIVRNLGGPQTRFLAQSSAEKRELEVFVEGCYGECNDYLPRILYHPSASSFPPGASVASTHPILLVAGGIGATFALPIYLELLDMRGGSTGVKFIWLVRTLDDARWGIALLEDPRRESEVAVDVDIYVTTISRKSSEGSSPSSYSSSRRGLTIHNSSSRPSLSTIIGPVLQASSTRSSSPIPPLISSSSRRSPDPRKRARYYDAKLTVLSCGPPSLVRDLRSEVGRHVAMYGREVEWHEEVFGFGGS